MGNTSLTRRVVLSLPLLALRPGAGRAADPLPALYAADRLSGLALHGFDPVSYALADGPAAGRPGSEFAWAGLFWRFAAASNRAAFVRDPGTFAPRLGGYDPEGVAEGRLVDADPLVPLRRDGRLYLCRDPDRRARTDGATLLAAEARWPLLAGEVGG
ncbi:hypothetical protein [uncultured Methylobacterium sp.]|jgi:hypothetical protein|uniref:hypothetical protein n=1 Tax=uncultured Methylobacterium sp. TaxID=157278 RepID=UPI00262824CC|nr:hypothetical protein [uncultured Methylobacterium sp.]